MLFSEKRHCDNCGELFRPRVPDQRFCRFWCRDEYKKAEARAARKIWRMAGKPKRMIEESDAALSASSPDDVVGAEEEGDVGQHPSGPASPSTLRRRTI